jgi:AbrB family looped-hinge helix DNA binding protein
MKITTNGRITIPIEVRRLLGVKPQDQVVFEIKDGRVELRPIGITLAKAYGAVPPLKRPIDTDEMREIIDEERAKRYRSHEQEQGG